MLFRLENVGKEFSGQWLFREVTLQANPDNHIGLIGPNGSGKTTLFDLIEERLFPDRGKVYRASELRISRVEQVPRFHPETSVRSEALKVFAQFRTVEARLQELESEMAGLEGGIPAAVADQYEELSLQLKLQGGYDYEARTEAVLMGLGLSGNLLDLPCGQLSGGQQNRLLLAQALLQPTDLLLLDEPTNHLDLQGTLWLTEYLREQKLSFVVVSHERHFLDQVTSRTWEIEQGRVNDYPGSFTRARQLRAERLRLQEKQYRRQQEWKQRTEEFIRRNIAAQKTKQAQSRRKQLEKVRWVEKPVHDAESLRLQIRAKNRGGALNFLVENATVGYPGKPLIETIRLRIGRGDRVGFLGENGTGKTTLLKTLLGELSPLQGRIEWGVNYAPAYLAQNPTPSADGSTVYDCLRELDLQCTDLELRQFAARFLFKEEDIHKKVQQLSGGEHSRLELARLLFHPANVLILDEPTNHLDVTSREALEEALEDYQGSLVVVSHDLYFLKRIAAEFYLIRDRRLVPIADLDELRFQDDKPREKRVSPKKPSAPGEPSLSKNERRRREGRLLEMEARIEALERRKEQILAALQAPYEDHSRLHDHSDQHQQIEEELKDLYAEWDHQAGQLTGGDRE